VRSLGNTVLYTAVGTLVNLFMSVLCAYPLSIRAFSGNRFFTRMIMVTMFFSGGMIPGFLVVKSLGLLNTLWALVLPGAISTYNMIVVRTFFQGIPSEMRESGHMDGANDLVLLFFIYLPLSMPVLATMTLFYATGHWNSYFSALIYITEKSRYPVQLILRNMLINDQMAEQYAATASEFDIVPITLKYASIMISTLPILLIYPFVQRYFVKGVMIGSLKG
nr:carbohydrate ABC transporter permease [Clostridia bacterium]